MMRSALLLASLLLLPFGPTLRAATVTGTLSNYSVEKTVVFTPIDRPSASADGFDISGPNPTSVRTVNYVYTATLGPGTYRMTIDGLLITYFRVLSTDEVVTVGSPTGVAFVLTTNELWRAKSDSTDTNALFLSSKLKAGSGISLAVTDTSGTNRQVEVSSTLAGTMTNVALTASEMHVAGSPLTGVGGTITLALTNDLKAVEAITGTGLATRTADNTWILRSVAAGSSKLTVANGNGASGNPTVDLGTVAISDITGLQTEIDTKQDLITATSDVTLSNLTVLGGITISGSGANAVDSLVVTNSLQLQNATASRFLVTDAAKNVTNTVAATGTGAPVLAVSPTLTNLTVSDVLNLPDAAVISADIDVSTRNLFSKSLSADTIFTFSNLYDGARWSVILTNGADWTAAWPTVTWLSGETPILDTGAGSVNVFHFLRSGGVVFGSAVQERDAILTSFGSLPNAEGALMNDGAGNLSYSGNEPLMAAGYDYAAPVNSTETGGAYTVNFGATNRAATLTLTGVVAYAYSGLSGTFIRTYNLWIKNAQATNCPMTFPDGTATNGIVGYNTAGKLGRLTFEYVPGWATNVFYSEAQ